ncbi:MAG: transcription termination/antitermination protein NusG [Elusimicrobiota bacterium]
MPYNWYIIKCRTQYEKKIKGQIEKAIESTGLQEKIKRIVIPHEEVVDIRKNKRYVKQEPYFKGYLFAEMEMDKKTYWIIKNITGVSGFLGGHNPTPLTETEAKSLVEGIESPAKTRPRPTVIYEKDESVRITSGPFKHFIGTVEDINEERGKLKVMVTIFGRPTPVELDFFQVEKM